MILTTAGGTGIRCYSSDDLKLMRLFGEGIKLDSNSFLEYYECFFCRAYGKLWAAGVPLWWRSQGEMFEKILLWPIGAEDEGSVLEEFARQQFHFSATIFAEKTLSFPSEADPVTQAIYEPSIHSVLSLDIQGRVWKRKSTTVSYWPGPMYPPGYQVVDNNYFYFEREDELDIVLKDPEAVKDASSSCASGGPDFPAVESSAQDASVDILGGGAIEHDRAVCNISLKFEKEMQLDLKLRDKKRSNSNCEKCDNVELAEAESVIEGGSNVDWFLKLIPNTIEEVVAKKGAEDGKPSITNVSEEIKLLRSAVADGSGSSFLVPAEAKTDCPACLGRLWYHKCGKKTLPAGMIAQRTLRQQAVSIF